MTFIPTSLMRKCVADLTLFRSKTPAGLNPTTIRLSPGKLYERVLIPPRRSNAFMAPELLLSCAPTIVNGVGFMSFARNAWPYACRRSLAAPLVGQAGYDSWQLLRLRLDGPATRHWSGLIWLHMDCS